MRNTIITFLLVVFLAGTGIKETRAQTCNANTFYGYTYAVKTHCEPLYYGYDGLLYQNCRAARWQSTYGSTMVYFWSNGRWTYTWYTGTYYWYEWYYFTRRAY